MEALRGIVRGILGSSSWLYRAGSRLLSFLAVARKEGMGTWRTLRRLENAKAGSTAPVSVGLTGLRHPVSLRPGTLDVTVVISTVIREQYGQCKVPGDPEWMIDAGAYIGDTAAYFLSRYPSLNVIALEPNPSTYAMAVENLRPYGHRVVLLDKGLWASEQPVCFGGESGGASIRESGLEIQTTSIPALLEEYSMPRLSILKMDIEGAEEPIFSSEPQAWLGRVDLLIIELHGRAIESLVRRVLLDSGFSMRRYRSVWYCRPRG